ncbi:permease [Desulfomonile tiedjei]|uniref:Putative permease n=1 Tax=Desulfomonile tiedjei (strain ATCC 49306 / DSM 6799 / DCB-1) TaxID=706587 RepID=I4C9C5_DESTA|nr:permease [Desulfomonile tiedjei]AFM26166.1 putative permease [Desulfomonile tiedjei DSM 6799]
MSNDHHCSQTEYHVTSCTCGDSNSQNLSVADVNSANYQGTFNFTFLIEAAFLIFAAGLLVFGKGLGIDTAVNDLSISFVAIMLEAMPFMLIGAVIGGLIETFIPQEWVSRILAGRTHTSILIAAGLGAVFPVCECAIIPVVRRLLHKGVPASAAIAFLLGGPIVNPVVAGSTWLAYRGDWTFLGTRMVFGYGIAVAIALIMSFLFQQKDMLLEDAHALTHSACGCGAHDHGDSHRSVTQRLLAAFQHACDDFFDVGKFLVIGAFVAAGCRTIIGVDVFRELFASPGLAIIAMMALAMALNLCSETDAFIAAGFRGVLPDTAQMAFMLLGPMLDVKLLLMYLTMFRKRTILVLSLLIFGMVLACTSFLQYGLGGLPGAQ